MGTKKEFSYLEFAEKMTSAVYDLKAVVEKSNEAFAMLEHMPAPKDVRDEAIRMVIDNTSSMFNDSLKMVVMILEMYERGKYVSDRKRDDAN